jgi:O-antigen/teichoic acid export membrane protein
MGLIIRQGLKTSVGFYIGVILGAINTLFISTRFFSTDELAISRLLTENSLIFAAFAHLGAPNISDRFFARFKDKDQQNNGFLIILLMFPILGFLIISVFYFFFQNNIQSIYLAKSPSVIPFLWLSLPMTFMWAVTMVLEAYSRANHRTAIPTFIRETVFRFFNIILIILLGLKFFDFKVFLLLNLVLMAVLVLLMVFYIKNLGIFYLDFKYIKISKVLLIEILKFGVILIIGGLGVNFILFIDRNIIAQKIGTESVAIFVVSAYIASIIEIPAKSIKQISGPILSNYIYQNNHFEISRLYKKSALNLMLVGGLMLVLICVNIENLFSILPKAEIYSKGKWVVLIISFCKWIEMSLGLNTEMIGFSKYYKVNTYLVLVLACLVVILNYVLIPLFGLNGSAIATGIVTIIASVFRFLFVYSKFKINPFIIRDFTIIGLMLVGLIFGFLLPKIGNDFISVMITISFRSLIIILFFGYFLIKLKISEDVNFLYLNSLKKLKGFLNKS